MRKVLSIDGGGIRGLIPALVIEEIEKKTGKPASSLFDLMVGTSTGGILALGLSLARSDDASPRYSARDLAKLYADRGRDVFPRSFWRGVSTIGGLTEEKYPADGVESVLAEYFGDAPLSEALTHVMVTSYDIQNRVPFFLKSWRADRNAVEMKDAARATSAAPTYFEPALVGVGGSVRALVDGGVFVNNPAMSAFAEARLLFPGEDVYLVSIGTGELIRPISYEESKDWGLAQWAIPILNVVFDGVSDAVDYQLRHVLGDDVVRFQTSLARANDDMDDASARNIDALRAEARRLIRSRRDALDGVCERLAA